MDQVYLKDKIQQMVQRHIINIQTIQHSLIILLKYILHIPHS